MRKNFPVSDIQYLLDEKAKLMSVTTTDSHITYANDDFIDASGYDFEEILHQPHNIVRHPDMPPQAFADMWATLKAGKIWTAVVKNRRKNGDYYWVKASTTPLMKEGKITGYMSVRTRVSQEEIRQAEALYHHMNENKLKNRRLFQGLLIYKGPLKLLSLFTVIPIRWRIRSYIFLFMLFALLFLLATLPLTTPLLTFVLALLAGATITSELLVQHLAKPLEKILRQAINSASGQADNSFQLNRVDEVGMLLRAVNQSGMNFRTFVDDVNGKLAELRHACGEIASGNYTLSQRCEDTAQSLQSTASSMEELTATMTRSSKEITDIISVLDNLAFQTNILALNAAVEAAHAGEQGKSFAVVAGEVRILAQRSAAAAKDIAAIIDATIANIHTSDKLVNHTSQSMNNILAQVQQVSQLVNQISLATQEQSQGLGQINSAVNNIDELTRQNTILATHSSSAINSLEQQISTMSEAVSVFSTSR
ncbi:methyl-accepting chemotaxis protein [Pectobacterium carotovorum]|uniref:methyl-accepting chemotaxis protein n=1 Tax=Pectobacterium carotovorum TaxID=554 RepID=UPI001373828A|nr:PAS domain-containing methyl-accepting chemotaxis protein [Pectobacterium carotovorum]QHP58140.1 PAS domain-containing protein [Pectobacterium carotovorum subsp. carotovorum]